MSRTYATAYTNPCLIALLAGSGDWVAVSEPGMALAPWDQTLPVAPSGVTVTNSRPVGGGGGVPRFKAFSSHPRLWIFPAVFFFFGPRMTLTGLQIGEGGAGRTVKSEQAGEEADVREMGRRC